MTLKSRCAGLLLLSAALALTDAQALANGNTTADTPPKAGAQAKEAEQPVKKAVRRAPISKKKSSSAKKAPAKSAKQQRSAVQAAPAVQRQRTNSLETGIALMQSERYEAARPWLQRAIQENKNSAMAWYWYAMYHEMTGKFYEAQYFYTKAVQIDPSIEPLSRVVIYPNEGDKTPLWDPKRPARIYPVPTDANGAPTIPQDAPQARRRPTRPPLDPELPHVPVYMPPEAGGLPGTDGAQHTAIYVPPGGSSIIEGVDAAYIPPSPEETGFRREPPMVAEIVPGAPAYTPPRSGQTPRALAVPQQIRTGNEHEPIYQPPQPEPGQIIMSNDPQNVPVYMPPMPDGSQTAYRPGNAAVYQPPMPDEMKSAPKKAAEQPKPAAKKKRTPVKQVKAAKKTAAPKAEIPEQPAVPEPTPVPEAPVFIDEPEMPSYQGEGNLPPIGQEEPVRGPSVLPPIGQD